MVTTCSPGRIREDYSRLELDDLFLPSVFQRIVQPEVLSHGRTSKYRHARPRRSLLS